VRVVVAVLSIVSMLAGSGCALTGLVLRAPTARPPTQPDRGHGRAVVVVVPFAGERSQPHRCGMKKNGYGFDTASLTCDRAPELFLAQRLAQHLEAAGFDVVDDAAGASWQVQGVLRELFVEPDIGLVLVSPEADIEVQIIVTNREGLRAERVFYVKHVEATLIPSDGAFQSSFEAVVEKHSVVVTGAIIELMDRYP
jgi:hypothetical protein